VRDGDDLMTLFALDRLQRRQLPGLVVTSMTNLGVSRAQELEIFSKRATH
jgi:phosphomannomutase